MKKLFWLTTYVFAFRRKICYAVFFYLFFGLSYFCFFWLDKIKKNKQSKKKIIKKKAPAAEKNNKKKGSEKFNKFNKINKINKIHIFNKLNNVLLFNKSNNPAPSGAVRFFCYFLFCRIFVFFGLIKSNKTKRKKLCY